MTRIAVAMTLVTAVCSSMAYAQQPGAPEKANEPRDLVTDYIGTVHSKLARLPAYDDLFYVTDHGEGVTMHGPTVLPNQKGAAISKPTNVFALVTSSTLSIKPL